MIHQPSGGAQGQATEIQIACRAYSEDTKKELNRFLAANTGQPLEVIVKEQDTERDNFMTAEEAYGLRVLTSRLRKSNVH